MSNIISRYDDFGRGITYIDGKICFVNNALIDEEVDIEVVNEKSKYIEAKTNNIIKNSNKRKNPECPFFLNCGGCNIMHMKYDEQLLFKKNKVINILSRFANLNNIVKEILPSKEFIYRNKISLKVIDGKLGYFKDNTNELIEIDKCLLVSGAINETIKELKKINLNNINEVIIRSNYKSDVLLYLEGSNIDDNYLINKLYKISNIVVKDNTRRIIKGNDFIIDSINDYNFKVSVESFFQVNSYGVGVLYKKVLEYAKLTKNEKVLDLYCGTGTIGIFLSKDSKEVYGIEINKKAIEDANYNKELNNIGNINFICSDVGKIKEEFKDIDLVVIDPPRAGLSKDAINNVLDINAKKIIYVSCDPITLARDLKELGNNYDAKEVTLVDMFPNTYHVECVCLLMKKNS